MTWPATWRKRMRVLARAARLPTSVRAGIVVAALLGIAAGAGASAFSGQVPAPPNERPGLKAAADADLADAGFVRGRVAAGPRDGGAGPQDRPPRPFDHARHERLSCRECHGAGAQHRTHLVRSARDCAACHHDARRGNVCADCHPRARLSEPRAVPTTLMLSVRERPQLRDLPFAHELHAGLACQDCHRTPVSLARDTECAACHGEHHRPEADCARCHAPVERSVHGSDSHLSCAAAECHAPAVAPLPVRSRSLCLLCHSEQVDHEPGGECTSCHQIPDLSVLRAGADGSVAPRRSTAP